MSPRDLSELSLEELRGLSDPGGPLAMRWCATCDRHYRFCECGESAVWMLRCDGELGPMPDTPGGPRSLQSVIDGAPPAAPVLGPEDFMRLQQLKERLLVTMLARLGGEITIPATEIAEQDGKNIALQTDVPGYFILSIVPD